MNLPAFGFRRSSFAVLTLLASIGCTMDALASGDTECSKVWRLVHHSYDGCSNMAFLSPSNDSRVNLLLMMADLRSAKPGSVLKTSRSSPPDAPLFLWEQLANTLGSQADKTAFSNDDMQAQNNAVPCPATLRSNDPFTVALQADHELEPEERQALLAARKMTQRGCAADTAVSALAKAEQVVKTASGKAYTRYLEGAAEFWRADYDKSAATFSALTSAQPAWVRETSTYMVGRSFINRAQVGAFDEYGSFNKGWHADPRTVIAAEAALDNYLRQYPTGAYAQSARGLKRRAYWLAQDTAKLEQEYGALLLLSPEERNLSDARLAEEIDNKIATPPDAIGSADDGASEDELLQSVHNPVLLAMLDLEAMRTSARGGMAGSEGKHDDRMPISSLQQQKPSFAGQMPLYEYLLAVHAFYVENKPAEVLRLIPDAAHQSSFSYLQFSRQMLRGMALEALKDHNALGFWTRMLPGAKAAYERPALELAIAYHEERAGEIRNVFAPASPVHYPYLREVLLANVADADLLRTQAKNHNAPQRERDIALFTLLYKEGTRSDAASFLKDLTLVPATAPTGGYYTLDDDASYFTPDEQQSPSAIPLGVFLHGKTDPNFGCPGLRVSEEQLVQDANNPTSQLCVADFVRLNQSVAYLRSAAPPADELGGTPSLFPGANFEPMNTYSTVLANTKSSRNDRAYALFRALSCYSHSGNNSCGGKDVSLSQRKAWFTTLKHDYRGTRWANALRYYW